MATVIDNMGEAQLDLESHEEAAVPQNQQLAEVSE